MNNLKVETSSGNVFADLGFKDAAERLQKANLAVRIAQLIEEKGWSETQTSARMGLQPSEVMLLKRGRLSGFSTDFLMGVLNTLGA
jgi:predicted XRE-type DNA-binding protein